MIIGVNHPIYQNRLRSLKLANRYNGAFYYAKEIEQNIIPLVNTDRSWVLSNAGICEDRAIVFIHDNKTSAITYNWLKGYKDLILVCGIPETRKKVEHLGTPIYLPLSIDVEYVQQFESDYKPHNYAYAGRPGKKQGTRLPYDCPSLSGMPREQLLKAMASFETIFAVGRTAIEARALGCKIGVYDQRFPDASVWKVVDNRDAARMLQDELNIIDKEKKLREADESYNPFRLAPTEFYN